MKLLRVMFVFGDDQIVLYFFEEDWVHTISVEKDAEFYADLEIERQSEAFFLRNRE